MQKSGDSPWNEIVGLILMGVGLVLLLALLSYSSSDPSWNSTGPNVNARNWIGPMGAKIADGLYQAFGLAALAIPLTFFLSGWWEWQEPRPNASKPETLGVFLMIIAFTGVLAMFGPEKPKYFYIGGFVGRWLVYGPGIGLVSLFGKLGGFVALMILFSIGVLIATPLSIAGFLMNLSPTEREKAGSVPGVLMGRVRNWRQEPEPPEPEVGLTPQRVRQKFAQQKQAAKGMAPASGVRLTVRHRQNSEHPAVPDTEPLSHSEDELPATPPPVEEPIIAKMSEPMRPPKPTLHGPATAVGVAKAVPLAGAASRRTAPAEEIPEALNPDGAGPGDEFDDATSSAQRSVDEMMATASVKRVDLLEPPVKKTKVADMVKAAARVARDYKLPSTEMLSPPASRPEMEEAELMERARQLAEKCKEFNVSGMVKQISPGPVVTTFEFKPDPGVKYSRIVGLVDDLCLGLKAESVRIDRIPGKSTVGIEVPNDNREMIRLREVIESKKFHDSPSKLTLALGKTIDGSNYAADLARMPHLLIAGATGAGKSVALNTLLVSMLYKASPEEVKFILVDPKRLELGLYADIPHLLTPIVTDPKRASYALKWVVSEMENRYKHLAQFGVRNIDQYNTDVTAAATARRKAGEEEPEDAAKPLPYIVVIIDELADLMMVSARDVEESITRLAQMARAVGIHLVLATQRPSVDVITGLIKANFPSRISFRVSSKVDSRTIIDTNGAEQLLGQGDMLFLPPGTSRLIRVHGAYVDEKEVKRICDFVRSQARPAYDDKIGMSEKELQGDEFGEFKKDEKYDDAVRVVVEMGRASTSVLQRRLGIGYGRAASIIDMMEREGIVGPQEGASKPRQVLIKADFLERLDQIREEGDY
ncbi:MAG: DNA translocase FtsK [Blastocatellia bacterium]|nr:DNA translocase FtsK [Blastocatellia bacterium]